MELKVLSEDIITLSSESGDLKIEKLSLLDVCQPNLYVNFCYFFKNNSESDFMSPKNMKNGLQIALQVYPEVAGSIEYTENASLLCHNNRGVKVVTSEANFSIADVEAVNFDMEKLPETQIFPPEVKKIPLAQDDYLFVAQIIYLNDKSVMLTVSLNHRLCDAQGIFQFVNLWAYATKNGNIGKFANETDRSLLVGNGKKADVLKLNRGYIAVLTTLSQMPPLPSVVSHKFDISFDKLESFKKELSKDMAGSLCISKNDILTAVFWKALVQARIYKKSESTLLAMVVNSRERFGLPDQYFGIVFHFYVKDLIQKILLT